MFQNKEIGTRDSPLYEFECSMERLNLSRFVNTRTPAAAAPCHSLEEAQSRTGVGDRPQPLSVGVPKPRPTSRKSRPADMRQLNVVLIKMKSIGAVFHSDSLSLRRNDGFLHHPSLVYKP